MPSKLILKGMGVSVGVVSGRACIVVSSNDYDKLQAGDILVTTITDPSMTIIINKSNGIICDIGGMTSHPAIISRELGIPAVVGVKSATAVLQDGMQIEINGKTGEIFLVE